MLRIVTRRTNKRGDDPVALTAKSSSIYNGLVSLYNGWRTANEKELFT